MKQANRGQTGSSLLTVCALGVAVMFWLYAITATVIPTYQRASEQRYLTVVRSAAEAGLDYAVSQLNQAIQSGTTSLLDNGLPATVPVSALGNSGANVTVTVANTTPPSTSSIYNSLYAGPFPNQSSGVQSNGWRMVTAVSSYAGAGKTIRVVLEPVYGSIGSSQSSTQYPNFPYAALAQGPIVMSNSAYTNGYNSANGSYNATIDSKGGSVATNDSPSSSMPISLTNTAQVGGNVSIFNQPAQVSTNTISLTNSSTVAGNVTSNGGVSSTSGIGGTVLTGQNSPPAGIPTNNLNLPSTDTSAPLQETVSGKGSTSVTTITQPAANTYVALNTVALTNSQVLNIPPGDYTINALTLSNSAKLNIVAGSNGQYGPVRLYFSGGSSGTSLAISNSATVNNNSQMAGNLQLWISGSQKISLANSSSIYAVIEAPNANFTLDNSSQLFGAVIANTITLSNSASIHYDEALGSAQASSWKLTYPGSSTTPTAVQSSLKVVSWQEL